MNYALLAPQSRRFRHRYPRGRSGFSLVELLTVIFIISLLIAILIPSLNSARNAAKKITTAKEIDSIKIGLEMFKNENGSDFPQSNGYPPSFAHPPLGSFAFDSYLGQFPFHDSKPVVYGAHWLAAMLMGVDQQGYIKRSSVPRRTPPLEPPQWYKPDPFGDGKTVIERANLYLTPETTPTRKTKELPGRPPQHLAELFPNYDKMQDLPVIVDAFDQPILYYVSNTSGKTTNMLEDKREPNNEYGTTAQTKGPPFYFQQDNIGFTGDKVIDAEQGTTNGWDFGSTGAKHTIALSGADLTAQDLIDPDPTKRNTFARYIVDRKVYAKMLADTERGGSVEPATPLRPVNADTYLLISAGVDGLFGTTDDVSNIPPFTEQ